MLRWALIFFVVALIAAPIPTGIMTLLPDQASKPNYLGYYSTCSFAPYSTLILFALVVIGVVLLIKTKPIHKLIGIFRDQ